MRAMFKSRYAARNFTLSLLGMTVYGIPAEYIRFPSALWCVAMAEIGAGSHSDYDSYDINDLGDLLIAMGESIKDESEKPKAKILEYSKE